MITFNPSIGLIRTIEQGYIEDIISILRQYDRRFFRITVSGEDNVDGMNNDSLNITGDMGTGDFESFITMLNDYCSSRDLIISYNTDLVERSRTVSLIGTVIPAMRSYYRFTISIRSNIRYEPAQQRRARRNIYEDEEDVFIQRCSLCNGEVPLNENGICDECMRRESGAGPSRFINFRPQMEAPPLPRLDPEYFEDIARRREEAQRNAQLDNRVRYARLPSGRMQPLYPIENQPIAEAPRYFNDVRMEDIPQPQYIGEPRQFNDVDMPDIRPPPIPPIEPGDACPICFEEFDRETDNIIVPSCCRRHFTHSECLQRWLETRDTCPVCRCTFRDVIQVNVPPPPIPPIEPGDECPICFEEFDRATDHIVVPSCCRRHFTHFNCLQRWLESRDTCPVCRCTFRDVIEVNVPDQPVVAPQQEEEQADGRGEIIPDIVLARECPYCLEEFDFETDNIVVPSCCRRHMIHDNCIRQLDNNECPTCRCQYQNLIRVRLSEDQLREMREAPERFEFRVRSRRPLKKRGKKTKKYY
jgi:hypothetical protein